MEFVVLMAILCCLCVFMFIPISTATFIINEKDDFEVIEEGLPPCAESELYRIEYFSGVEKLNTTLLCKCNADRERTKMTNTEHPTKNNTWIRNSLCVKAPKKQVSVCFEHQICKREFLYDFGSYRICEQYVDTTEDYCDCQNGLECKKTGFLNKSLIFPHDNVLSYRCMPHILKYEELKPCVRNQSYLDVIYRYKSPSRKDTIKLNTYMKCICVTNGWSITEKPKSHDPADENQWVRTYICPWRHRPCYLSVETSCTEYAICREGYKGLKGIEEPDKWLIQYFSIFCRCDRGRQCLDVGGGRYETIHRCFNNKARNLRKNCKDGEVYRVDIHRKITRNGKTESTKIKLNTIQMCICSGNIIRMGNDTGPYSFNEYITKYRCQKNATLKKTELPYCFKNEVCRFNDIEQMGSERRDSTFRTRSVNTCICSFPRACIKAEEPNFSLEIDRCTLSNETENDLETCSYYEVYKVVIYTNLTDSKGVYNRDTKNTIFLCKCNHTLYDVDNGSSRTSRDPRDSKRRIKSYYCTPPKNNTKELQSCEENEICRKDVYKNYGEDVGPRDVKYLLNSFTYCKCDNNRRCYNTKKDDPSKADKTINTFRCVKKVCMENELCRILEYSWSKELEWNATLCHCTGNCSVNSVAYSMEHQNKTEHYTCKIPSSA